MILKILVQYNTIIFGHPIYNVMMMRAISLEYFTLLLKAVQLYDTNAHPPKIYWNLGGINFFFFFKSNGTVLRVRHHSNSVHSTSYQYIHNLFSNGHNWNDTVPYNNSEVRYNFYLSVSFVSFTKIFFFSCGGSIVKPSL